MSVNILHTTTRAYGASCSSSASIAEVDNTLSTGASRQKINCVCTCTELPKSITDEYSMDHSGKDVARDALTEYPSQEWCYMGKECRTDVWYHSRYQSGIYEFKAIVPSTRYIITHRGNYTSRFLGDILCTDKLLSVCGYYITLYTDSSYVANVFNSWSDRWLSNNYNTVTRRKVKHHSIIHAMIARGCRKVRYIDTNGDSSSAPHIADLEGWKILVL
jgi:hypothetical protein